MEKIDLNKKIKTIRKAINGSLYVSAISIIVGSNPSYADTTYHIQFSWKPNFELEVKNGGGYNIYADENGGTTYTKRNSFEHNSICGPERCYATINDLDPLKSYRFVATAYDTQGNESDYSTAIPITGDQMNITPDTYRPLCEILSITQSDTPIQIPTNTTELNSLEETIPTSEQTLQ